MLLPLLLLFTRGSPSEREPELCQIAFLSESAVRGLVTLELPRGSLDLKRLAFSAMLSAASATDAVAGRS